MSKSNVGVWGIVSRGSSSEIALRSQISNFRFQRTCPPRTERLPAPAFTLEAVGKIDSVCGAHARTIAPREAERNPGVTRDSLKRAFETRGPIATPRVTRVPHAFEIEAIDHHVPLRFTW